MIYLAYGVAIASDLVLDLPAGAGPPQLTVQAGPGPVDDDAVDWFASSDDLWEGGRLSDGRFVLRFDGEAELVIGAEGTAVHWWSPTGISSTLAHLVLDHALPQAMMRRGRVALHASSLLAPDGRCFAIAGQSGQGKSTLAAALSGRQHRLLGDDCAVIDVGPGGPLLAPAYPGLRLFEESLVVVQPAGARRAGPVSEGSDKVRVALDDGTDWDGLHSVHLDAVVVLSPTPIDPPGIQRLGPAAAVVSLLTHSFHLGDVSEREELLGRMGALVDACPVVAIHYEHSTSGLARALALVGEVR